MHITIKKLVTIGATMTLAGVLAAGNAAAAELEAAADARIQPPLRLTEELPLSFGDLVVTDEEATATYTLLAGGGTVEDNVTSMAAGNLGEFTVSGRDGESVLITFPASVVMACTEEAGSTCINGTDTLTIDGFETDYAGDSIPLVTGTGNRSTETFFVGAALQIPAVAADGLYEGTYTVTANYE